MLLPVGVFDSTIIIDHRAAQNYRLQHGATKAAIGV
jgi:hypothetical protein